MSVHYLPCAHPSNMVDLTTGPCPEDVSWLSFHPIVRHKMQAAFWRDSTHVLKEYSESSPPRVHVSGSQAGADNMKPGPDSPGATRVLFSALPSSPKYPHDPGKQRERAGGPHITVHIMFKWHHTCLTGFRQLLRWKSGHDIWGHSLAPSLSTTPCMSAFTFSLVRY
jgi:hypothetical protein